MNSGSQMDLNNIYGLSNSSRLNDSSINDLEKMASYNLKNSQRSTNNQMQRSNMENMENRNNLDSTDTYGSYQRNSNTTVIPPTALRNDNQLITRQFSHGNLMNVSPDNAQDLNDFMRTQIGKDVSIDFLVGDSSIVNKSGTLLGVGSNYIVLHNKETNEIIAGEASNIKFVSLYY